MKFGCSNCFFLSTTNLICRSTDISKCFRGSLRFRDNKSRLYIRHVIILNSDKFPERQSGKLIISIVMDYIINLLFTLLQIVANDKIISRIVIMISIKADLMGKMNKI